MVETESRTSLVSGDTKQNIYINPRNVVARFFVRHIERGNKLWQHRDTVLTEDQYRLHQDQ